MSAKKGSKTTTRFRSSDSGEFVKKSEADRKPKEHQREQVPKPGHGDTGRKKK